MLRDLEHPGAVRVLVLFVVFLVAAVVTPAVLLRRSFRTFTRSKASSTDRVAVS